MRAFLIAILCLVCSAPVFAQNGDEPASKDDILLYLRTMRSHDLLIRTMEVQSKTTQQLLYEQIKKEKGSVPSDFETHMKAAMDRLIKNFPADEVTEAMVPAYQKHFTHGDIQAMNAFYSSPVGQKVLQELPAVMQEGSQAALPLMSKYLSDWQDSIQKELENSEKKSAAGATNSGENSPPDKKPE